MERSALPSPADWSEFINASNSKVERDLAQLTLSDPEQRELYEAARLVQTAFCKYKVQAPPGSGAVSASAPAVGCLFDLGVLTWIIVVFRTMVQVTDDLSAAVVSSHTLTLVLCLYFCLCLSS